MSYTVDFTNVSTVGLEASPVADALAGLRANEARYFKNKYDVDFTVEPASKSKKILDYVNRILKEERDIVIASRPLEAPAFQPIGGGGRACGIDDLVPLRGRLNGLDA